LNDPINDGGGIYCIRIRPQNYTQRPILSYVRTRAWITLDASGPYAGKVRIPGWDPANDVNGDGYVDDTEFASLVNPLATARFRHEARVAPIGVMWSPTSTFCRPNLWNPNYAMLQGQTLKAAWTQQQAIGAYQDDAALLLGAGVFPVLSGGALWETNGNVQDDAVNLDYRDHFLQEFQTIKTATGTHWLGANLGNTFIDSFLRPYNNVLDWLNLESEYWDSTAISNGLGVAGQWYIPAYAARGIKSMMSTQVKSFGLLSVLPNTQDSWERAITVLLAKAYLVQVPGYSYFNVWNNGFYYGSGNTWLGAGSYYKAGVPMNYAYQPSRLLSVDIGQPSNQIPGGYTPMYWEDLTNYNYLGRSTDATIKDPLNLAATLPVVPTYSFVLYSRNSDPYSKNQFATGEGNPASNQMVDWPGDMVIARQYTRGLVVVRLSQFGGLADFAGYISDANQITVTLPKAYCRANYDGTLGPLTTQITLRGYEGAILQDPAVSTPTVTIPVSPELVSKTALQGSALAFKPQPASAGPVTLSVTLIPSSGISGPVSAAARPTASGGSIQLAGVDSTVSLAGQTIAPGTYSLAAVASNAAGHSGTLSDVIFIMPSDLSGLEVYPNPWRADRPAHAAHPFVTFSGLTLGTKVKLFTVAGREARELHTDGPSIAWDLTNDAGDKVASGVYLYVITDSQGDKVRGKLAIIR
jgi:hypothetical protein